MLVLTRKVGSSIVIDGQIKIQVVQVRGRQVRLGISAPKTTKVHREEVQESIGNRESVPRPRPLPAPQTAHPQTAHPQTAHPQTKAQRLKKFGVYAPPF